MHRHLCHDLLDNHNIPDSIDHLSFVGSLKAETESMYINCLTSLPLTCIAYKFITRLIFCSWLNYCICI